MFAAVSQGIMSAQQLHDLIYSSLDTALAAAKMGLKVSDGAPRELGFALEAYGAELKHKASTMLQVRVRSMQSVGTSLCCCDKLLLSASLVGEMCSCSVPCSAHMVGWADPCEMSDSVSMWLCMHVVQLGVPTSCIACMVSP
jgi:hypothetical protein